jgi:hypothetical protein
VAREDRLIRENVDRTVLETPILTADHVKYIKDVIINSLRDVFSRDPDYTYIKDEDGIFPDFDNENLGIVITDVFNYDVEFLPAITIRVNSSTLVPVSFNQNQFTLDYEKDESGNLVRDAAGKPIPVWQEFSGLYDTTATLNVHTWDPLAREELVTRVAIMFKHVLRDQLYADFGFFVKEVTVGGESETDYHNDFIYSQPVSITVLTGWNNRIPIEGPLEGINLQIIGDAVRSQTPSLGCRATPVEPTKQELEESNRVDWLDEIRDCPALVLEDALEYDTASGNFILTEDWLQILGICGVTIEDAITQINTGSSLRRNLIEFTDVLRQRANNFRNNKSQGIRSGSPPNFKFRFQGANVTVFPDDSVRFPGGATVSADGTASYPVSQITVTASNEVTGPSGLDLDKGADPFTATTLEGLEAFQFFLILLDVDSPARQSLFSLNNLIDDFLGILTDSAQITEMESVKAEINDLVENRFLLNRITNLG